MYQKYRVFIQTTRGGYFASASNTVNGLAPLVASWLERTSVGRSVYDDVVKAVILYVLDKKQGNYVRSASLPADNRRDIIKKIRMLGAR